MLKHSNKTHGRQGATDIERFMPARLQSWFGEKREQYWAVWSDEVGGVAEEQDSDDEEHGGGGDVLAMTQSIRQDIQQWEPEAQEHRLRLLERALAQEIDPWHQFTGWETVLRAGR